MHAPIARWPNSYSSYVRVITTYALWGTRHVHEQIWVAVSARPSEMNGQMARKEGGEIKTSVTQAGDRGGLLRTLATADQIESVRGTHASIVDRFECRANIFCRAPFCLKLRSLQTFGR